MLFSADNMLRLFCENLMNILRLITSKALFLEMVSKLPEYHEAKLIDFISELSSHKGIK